MSHPTCQFCQREFIPHPRGKGRFCSKTCWRAFEAAQRPVKTCERCGKEFRKLPCNLGRFCSRECHNQTRTRIPLADRFWRFVNKTDRCWLWTGRPDRMGYGHIAQGVGLSPLLAHRVSWEIHFGSIPEGQMVLHRCDNPPCVRPDHLFLGDQLDNMQDCSAKGRTNRGERSGTAKLTEDEVRTILGRVANGERNLSKLGREYGVSGATISLIVKGVNWSHVTLRS